MGKFRPRPELDKIVAKMVVPAITALTEKAADGAKKAAPPEKIWLSEDDERVRPEHVKAHDQHVPKNLRFTLDSPQYDREHYGAGEIQMGRKPKHKGNGEDGFTPGLTANCRCFLSEDPKGVAKTIKAHRARAAGTKVTGRVTCDHELAVPAEFGNSRDVGARFMSKGLAAAKNAARKRR